MDICTAYVSLGGDPGSIVVRGSHNPLTWPEIGLLQFLHGENSVFNVKVIGEISRHRNSEKERLIGIYGEMPVAMVYPGRTPIGMEMKMPGGPDPDDTDEDIENDMRDISEIEFDEKMTALASNEGSRGKRKKKQIAESGAVIVLPGGKEVPIPQEEDV
jgi:hypothetical protein